MTFDAEYFDRFYERRSTRVYDATKVAELARSVMSMIRWLGGETKSVLDVGAGPGFWRSYLKAHERGVRYTSIDASPYACERYGHLHRDIARWRSNERFDLVVCQGVLPYLNDDDARAAIANIGAMSSGFFYLEAITTRDIREVCDLDKTDAHVHKRSGDFYLRAASEHFVRLGCGLFYSKRGPLGFYELEALT
jgi:SAM-dependent methyltransferase